MYHEKSIMIDLACLHKKRPSVGDMSIQPPKPNISNFLEKLSQYYDVYIFAKKKRENVEKWLIDNDLDKYIIDIHTKKTDKHTLFLNRKNVAMIRKIAFLTSKDFLLSLDLYYDENDYGYIIENLELFSEKIY